MLKVIGGIAKVWLGEIIEGAKEIQVKEDYRKRELIGLNEKLMKKRDFKAEEKERERENDIDVNEGRQEKKDVDKEGEERENIDEEDEVQDNNSNKSEK